MKKNNTMLLIGAALLLYYLMKMKKNNKAAALPGSTDKVYQAQMNNLDVIKSQTVNFEQVVPTPATIMDMPRSSNNYSNSYCNCNRNRGITGMPYVC